jgi:hypothetical protein
MFDIANTLPRQGSRPRDTGAPAPGLCQPGFGVQSPGIAERISVREVLRAGPDASDTLQRLARMANDNVPLCLSPVDFGAEPDAIDAWRDFCDAVAAALSLGRPGSTGPGLCIQSHQLPLEAYCLVADAVLGQGPRYVFLDSLQMGAHCNRIVEERSASNWTFLWRHRRHDRPVMPVYGGIVRSACPLLSDEVALSVLPEGGLQVPDNSAWLTIRLPLPRFADASGRMDEAQLSEALRQAIRVADVQHERQPWQSARQRVDAKNNRRMAFFVTGIGDLVVNSGRDPRDLATLRWLCGIMRKIRHELCETSGRMAQQYGALPALNHAHPGKNLPDGPQGAAWRRHFERAARKAAVRHRNLLAISPYGVLPSTEPYENAFTDLLPIIAFADAWGFANPPAFAGWNVTQYQHFHRRARAIIQGSQAASFVAAGV